jgi:hypothetical protein
MSGDQFCRPCADNPELHLELTAEAFFRGLPEIPTISAIVDSVSGTCQE